MHPYLRCIKYRVHEMHADWVVYVTDAGQMQHFKSFLACARKAGIYDPEAVSTVELRQGQPQSNLYKMTSYTVRINNGDSLNIVRVNNETFYTSSITESGLLYCKQGSAETWHFYSLFTLILYKFTQSNYE